VEASKGRSVHSYHAWALLERKQGNIDEAERLLKAAYKIEPYSTRVISSFAEICELKGDLKACRDLYRKGFSAAFERGDAGFIQVSNYYISSIISSSSL
jgi:Tfp pilus assembly protein PilF